MAELSEAEATCLRWCANLNPQAVGFLGPTVRKQGALDVYDRLVSEGFVRVVDGRTYRRTPEKYGYWLTDKGRAEAVHLRRVSPSIDRGRG